MPHRFTKEIDELRRLGFAEGLPIGESQAAPGVVARLESGRVGVAVEFCDHGPAYSMVPLEAGAGDAINASPHWEDIVRDVRRRLPPADDDD